MVVILVVLLPAAWPSQREKDKKKKIIKKGTYIQTKEVRRYLTRKDMDMGHPSVHSIDTSLHSGLLCLWWFKK
jgi:hypothetical protein